MERCLPRRPFRIATDRLVIRPLARRDLTGAHPVPQRARGGACTRSGRCRTPATSRRRCSTSSPAPNGPTPAAWVQLGDHRRRRPAASATSPCGSTRSALARDDRVHARPEAPGQGVRHRGGRSAPRLARRTPCPPRRSDARPRRTWRRRACSSGAGSGTPAPPGRRRSCAAPGRTTPGSRSSPRSGRRGDGRSR